MPVLADHVAGVVDRVDAVVLDRRGARGPAGIQRIEGADDRRRIAFTVAVAGQAQARCGPGAEHAVVRQQQLVAGAIDVVGMADAERRSGAEEVVFAQPDAARIFSAGPGGTDARDERPAVARHHLDVDDAVLVGHRADLHVVEIALAAQQTFGLVDHRHRDRVAALEQQGVLDDAGARLDVQRVRPSVERRGLPSGSGCRRRPRCGPGPRRCAPGRLRALRTKEERSPAIGLAPKGPRRAPWRRPTRTTTPAVAAGSWRGAWPRVP